MIRIGGIPGATFGTQQENYSRDSRNMAI